MATPILYGFLNDDALRKTSRLDLTGSTDQGYGYLDGEPACYLVNPATLWDTRSRRSMILESESPKGQVKILFDQDRFDPEILNKLDDLNTQRLFNIIERVYLQQNYTDTTIERELTSEIGYTGYVADSYIHSGNTGRADATNISGVVKTIDLWDWCQFEFKTDDVDFIIKFWINRRAWTTDYPYTTITRIIPPIEPDILINTVKLLEVASLTMLTTGSNFVFDQTNLEMIARNQNGIYVYTTKYNVTASQNIQLPFALAYCGPRAPSNLECREAINEYLKQETGISDESLGALLPELFINSRFYIVPLWDLYSVTSERDVYNSVQKFNEINSRVDKVFSTFTTEYRNQYLELLLNAQNKTWSICLPDTLNSTHWSILEQHPTYQDYSSQVPGYKYMTAATQDFAGKLNRVFAALNGTSTSSEFTTVVDGQHTYLTFTSGESEYYVMTKDSYLSSMENT